MGKKLSQEEVDKLVEDFLREKPVTITTLIEELCIGPTENQVRHAAWKLLYDETKADLDEFMNVVIKKRIK